MRLFRGLKEPYRPEKVAVADRLHRPGTGTDFTDCPYTALRYAQGRRAVVLVVDVPAETRRVSQEFWFAGKARRFMIWGKFDDLVVAVLPAKELRARVRVKGMVAAPDEHKSKVLSRAVEELIRRRDPQ